MALLHKIAAAFIFRIQGLKIYSVIAKKFLREYVVIRDVALEDDKQLEEFFCSISREDIRKAIADTEKGELWLIAKWKDKLVGSVNVAARGENKRLYIISGLIVKTAFRRLGIGRMLIRQAIKRAQMLKCRALGIIVNRRSYVPQRLYKKSGFVKKAFPEDFQPVNDCDYLEYSIKETNSQN